MSKHRIFGPKPEVCIQGRSKEFPWTEEQVSTAWKQTYSENEMPEQSKVCQALSNDKAFYSNLRKIQSKASAKRDFMASKKQDKRGPKLKREDEKVKAAERLRLKMLKDKDQELYELEKQRLKEESAISKAKLKSRTLYRWELARKEVRRVMQQKKDEKAQRYKAGTLLRKKRLKQRAWTIDDWLDDPELFPFSQSHIEKAKRASVRHESEDYELKVLRRVFQDHIHEVEPFYLRAYKIGWHFKDPGSERFPTYEFPWSLKQLQSMFPDLEDPQYRDTFLDFIVEHSDKKEVMEVLKSNQPDFQFTLPSYSDTYAFHFTKENEGSIFLPWAAEKLALALKLFAPEHMLDEIPSRYGWNEDSRTKVRVMSMGLWAQDEKFRRYLLSLGPYPTTQQVAPPVAPWLDLIEGYYTWDIPWKEFGPDRLQLLWFVHIVQNTYDFLHPTRLATTYRNLFRDILNPNNTFMMIETFSGILILDEKAVHMLKDMNAPYKSAWMPIHDDLDMSVAAFRSWLRDTYMAIKEEALKDLHSESYAPSDEELDPVSDESSVLVKKINMIFRKEMNDYRLKVPIHLSFLTWIFLTTEPFQSHLAQSYLSLSSKKQIMLEKLTYRQGQRKSEILETWRGVKGKKLEEEIKKWFDSTNPEYWMDKSIQMYKQEALARTHQPVPLLAKADRYQSYMAERFNQYTMALSPFKPESDHCDTKKHDGPFFITPDKAQEFMAAAFQPSSPENGKIAIHSVGSGKTCMTVLIAFSFALAGYRIVWATKTALKNQVLKNHVSAICNLLIQLTYEKIRWSSGEQAAQSFLDSLPPETSFASVLQTLQNMGMNWVNLSYQQLTNALEMKNDVGRKWYAEAQLSSTTMKPDMLRKTLIIVDEPQKIFTGELSRSEMPYVPILHNALQYSYRTSDVLRARIVWLTATPMLTSPLPFMAMVNMCHAEDVYPMMHTLNPYTKEPWIGHKLEVRDRNEELEEKIGCDTFPTSSIMCWDPEANNALWNDEDPEEEQELKKRQTKKVKDDLEEEHETDDWFSARDVLNATLFDPKELRNTVNEFWQKTFGLVSYYNISADYTRFPRTEFMTVIMPSCTLFQEALMAQQIARKGVPLATIRRNIRRIASWAAYKRKSTDGDIKRQKPNAEDQEIMIDNAKHLFFEPTEEDLKERQALLEQDMSHLQNSERKRDMEKLIAYNKKNIAEFQARLHHLTSPAAQEEWTPASLKGQISRTKKLLHMEQTKLQHNEEELNSFEAIQTQQINGVKEAMLKLKKKWKNLKKAGLLEKRRKFKHISSQSVHVYEDLSQDVENLEEDEKDEVRHSLRQVRPQQHKKKRRKKLIELSQDALNEDEMDSESSDEDDELEEEDSGKLFSIKIWNATNKRVDPVPMKYPPYQWFDIPEEFEKKAFAEDLPLFSPKAAVMLRLFQQGIKDKEKVFIFCDGIHSIRAVAGALTTIGWTFGMSLKYVKWTKEYRDADSGQLVKAIHGKNPTLTWVPDKNQGKDYHRFLILTKSRMGGPGGANINEYTIQQVGSMNPASATYNHPDNVMGKDWRVVIVDRSFMEGIDLPSSVGILFDELDNDGERIQAVGRISRYCGMRGLPFIKGFGWPQRVFRMGLKFRENAIHFTTQQRENLFDELTRANSVYEDVVPRKFRQGFLDKLQKNIFSPRELEVLLAGRMDLQKLKKKTLDGYLHMLKNINIGGILYEPAMKNLELAEEAYLDLLAEETSTIKDYQRFIMQRDKRRTKEHRYNTRAALRDRLRQYRLQSTRVLPVVQNYVMRAIRATSPEDYHLWLDQDGLKRRNLLTHMVSEVKKDVYFYDVPVSEFELLMNEIIDSEINPRIQARQVKTEKNLSKLIKDLYNEARRELKINLRQLRSDPDLQSEVTDYMNQKLLARGYGIDTSLMDVFLDELMTAKVKAPSSQASMKMTSSTSKTKKVKSLTQPKFYSTINKFMKTNKITVKQLRLEQYRGKVLELIQYIMDEEKTTSELAENAVKMRVVKRTRNVNTVAKKASSAKPKTISSSSSSGSVTNGTKGNSTTKARLQRMIKSQGLNKKELRTNKEKRQTLMRDLSEQSHISYEEAKAVVKAYLNKKKTNSKRKSKSKK